MVSIFLLLILCLSAFPSFESPSSDTSDATFENPPGYLKTAKFVRSPNQARYEDDPLNGIGIATYGSRLKRSIEEFQRVIPPTDKIEITAEAFFNMLIAFIVANDDDLTNTQIIHQKNLVEYGRPDLVIERKIGNDLVDCMIIELKGFNRAWDDPSDKSDTEGFWEKQLCSYLLGYRKNTGKTAAGAISNLYGTVFYDCVLDVSDNRCTCETSDPLILFPDRTWRGFNRETFLKDFAPYWKHVFRTYGEAAQ